MLPEGLAAETLATRIGQLHRPSFARGSGPDRRVAAAGLRAILECLAGGCVLSRKRIPPGWIWEALVPGDRNVMEDRYEQV